MNVNQKSNYSRTLENDQNFGDYLRDVDRDLINLFLAMQGRVRFTDSGMGENIAGELVEFTTHATPGTAVTVNHRLNMIPYGRLIFTQNKAGALYEDMTTWTKTTVSFKSDVASVTFKVFLIK